MAFTDVNLLSVNGSNMQVQKQAHPRLASQSQMKSGGGMQHAQGESYRLWPYTNKFVYTDVLLPELDDKAHKIRLHGRLATRL